MAANVTRLANITNTVEQENVASAFIARGGPKARKKIKKNKSNRLYDHCQRFGHTANQCFKLIGYPNWYQGPRDNVRPRRNPRGNANLANVHSDGINNLDTPFEK